RRAPNGSAAQVHQMPGHGMSFFRGVFAHRRNSDAILQLNISQSKFCEELHAASVFSLASFSVPFTGARLPNNAVPTRTSVVPSAMAASKSCDIPIDNVGNFHPSRRSEE